MFFIIGFVVVFASVLGGYLPRGSFDILVQPLELLIIGGAAVDAYVISNPGAKSSSAQTIVIEMEDPVADMGDHLMVDMTPEGMRIQLIDQQDRSMLEPGSARINPSVRTLLVEVSKIIKNLLNRLAISGHTDAESLPASADYGNWELSTDRANASRIVPEKAGIENFRMNSVTGRAATEPLIIEGPYLPANRRVSIVLVREANVLPPKYHREMDYANGNGR